jgi:class 3 adenylate cyclase/DNA-binding NarL/FixJ family response regulator
VTVDLPAGTVTFLFTDIEESTALLRRLGERYGDVLSEHERLLRDEVDRFGGSVVDTQGDALFAAFPRATDAVAAAVAAQRALGERGWPDGVEVRVRMGLHSGEPAVAGSRYVGLGVHRAARVAAAARGGQILISAATYGLLGDEAPGDVSLRDAGEHELKGLDRRERLYEVMAPGLREREAEPRDQPLRVAVADDSVLVREGVGRLLAASGFDVVDTASDADELLDCVARAEPDVAIVDIKMPPTHTDEGLVAAERIRTDHPSVGVLVLSQYVDSRYAMRLLEHDPERVGYLLKDRVSDADTLGDAVRRIARGECVLDPEIVSRLVRRARREGPADRLSEDELEVLGRLAEGRSDDAIAEALGVDRDAVEQTTAAIFEKLELAGTPDELRRIVSVLGFLRG